MRSGGQRKVRPLSIALLGKGADALRAKETLSTAQHPSSGPKLLLETVAINAQLLRLARV